MQNNLYHLSQQVAQNLSKQEWTLSVAESCTGGGLAYVLTSVRGASSWFDRGFVTYCNQAKIEMLNVNPTTLARYGAVSSQTADEMVCGALEHSSADIAVSITGIAGPKGGSFHKVVGTVFFGLGVRGSNIEIKKKVFDGGRHNVRECSIGFVLTWLLEKLNQYL